jgi:hypothetical protein
MHLAKELSLAMPSQNWHDFLTIDLSNIPEKGETKVAKCRQEILDLLIPQSDLYAEVKTRNPSNDPLLWRGKEYQRGALPPENVV